MSQRKWVIAATIVAALLLLLGSFQRSAAKPPTPIELPQACEAVEILPAPAANLLSTALVPATMTEGFEGPWPSTGWRLLDNSDTDGGEYLVGKRDCHPHSGSNAGWTVGGGTQGTALGCDGEYPNNASSWAIYGPFSLVGATNASLTFYLYGVGEGVDDQGKCSYDYLFAGSSINGTNFTGTVHCGDWSQGTDDNGYHQRTIDLSHLLGQSQVWIAFRFRSDDSVTHNGYHVDDVALEVSTGPGTTATPTHTATVRTSPTPTLTPRPGGEVKVFLPLGFRNQRVAGATLRDSKGQPASALPISESLYADFGGLTPKTQYNIRVLKPNGAELTLSTFTTDGNGNIPASALAYDLGLNMARLQSATVTETGPYTVIILDRNGREVRRWTINVNEPTSPIIYAANSSGNALNSFLVNSHTVYARGERFTAGSQVRLYVVADRWEWAVGTPLADVTGNVETATVGGDGKFLVQVWVNPATIAAYDLIADVNGDGLYSAGDVVDSYIPVGFMVQRAGTGAHIQVQLACDANRNYKDVFLTTENVYIYVNPPTQQFVHEFGYKYVVHHRDTWNNGDDLVDITEGPERDHPQYGCTNEGRVLIWPATLTPGVYDVIFDINHNGKYDVGIDLLDNIDAFSNAVGGFFVPGAPGSPVVTITSPASGSSSTDGVITLEGTVSSTASALVWSKWYVNAGSQSNSGDLSVSNGRFSQQIYLFPGQNTVQVWVRNQQGTGTASIVVNSAVSGVWDIHAQLVWDVLGQDVDLHLRRPEGARNSSGDCYFSNCKSSDRARNPDWGLTGSADDNPRLDVDCTTQCSGPENITLNTLGRSQANGRYTVEAYYYSDHGKGTAHPKINLWVRGQLYTFGPVNLTNRQWWTVCTIDWPSGLVTPVGTIASRPEAGTEDSADRFPPKKEDKSQ